MIFNKFFLLFFVCSLLFLIFIILFFVFYLKLKLKLRKKENELIEKKISLDRVIERRAEATRSINHHLDQSREKMIEGLKTEFVAIAAHQLRTPISTIKWIVRMLIDGELGPLTLEQKDYLTKVYLSNEKMIRLINDLLNVSRIEEGKFLNKPQKADLVAVIEKAISLWKGAAERKGLSLVFEKPKIKKAKTNLDEDKISLVLQNLVDNAISYTEQGTVIIKAEYLKPNHEFKITVADTGIGIPKAQQEKVFTRFFRAGNAIKVDTEGTGLGLFIAKNIVQLHNGKIWFHSEEGKGTTFYFTLPAL